MRQGSPRKPIRLVYRTTFKIMLCQLQYWHRHFYKECFQFLYDKTSVRQSVYSADWFFLGRHFAKRKRSKPSIFVFKQSRQIQNWQPNSDKKYCHSLQRNYQKKLKRLKLSPDFNDGWRRRTFSDEFYYPEDLATFETGTEIGIIRRP